MHGRDESASRIADRQLCVSPTSCKGCAEAASLSLGRRAALKGDVLQPINLQEPARDERANLELNGALGFAVGRLLMLRCREGLEMLRGRGGGSDRNLRSR